MAIVSADGTAVDGVQPQGLGAVRSPQDSFKARYIAEHPSRRRGRFLLPAIAPLLAQGSGKATTPNPGTVPA